MAQLPDISTCDLDETREFTERPRTADFTLSIPEESAVFSDESGLDSLTRSVDDFHSNQTEFGGNYEQPGEESRHWRHCRMSQCSDSSTWQSTCCCTVCLEDKSGLSHETDHGIMSPGSANRCPGRSDDDGYQTFFGDGNGKKDSGYSTMNSAYRNFLVMLDKSSPSLKNDSSLLKENQLLRSILTSLQGKYFAVCKRLENSSPACQFRPKAEIQDGCSSDTTTSSSEDEITTKDESNEDMSEDEQFMAAHGSPSFVSEKSLNLLSRYVNMCRETVNALVCSVDELATGDELSDRDEVEDGENPQNRPELTIHNFNIRRRHERSVAWQAFVNDLRKSLQVMEQVLYKTREDLKNTNDALHQAQNQKDIIGELLEEAKEELKALEGDMESVLKKYSQLEDISAQKDERMKAMELTQMGLEKRIIELLQVLGQTVHKLQEKDSKAVEQKHTATTTKLEYEKQLEAIRNQLVNCRRELESERFRTAQEIKQLQDSLHNINSVHEIHMNSVKQEHFLRMNKLEGENRTLLKQLESKSQRLRDSENKLHFLEEQLAIHSHEGKNARKLIEDLENFVQVLEEEKQKLEILTTSKPGTFLSTDSNQQLAVMKASTTVNLVTLKRIEDVCSFVNTLLATHPLDAARRSGIGESFKSAFSKANLSVSGLSPNSRRASMSDSVLGVQNLANQWQTLVDRLALLAATETEWVTGAVEKASILAYTRRLNDEATKSGNQSQNQKQPVLNTKEEISSIQVSSNAKSTTVWKKVKNIEEELSRMKKLFRQSTHPQSTEGYVRLRQGDDETGQALFEKVVCCQNEIAELERALFDLDQFREYSEEADLLGSLPINSSENTSLDVSVPATASDLDLRRLMTSENGRQTAKRANQRLTERRWNEDRAARNSRKRRSKLTLPGELVLLENRTSVAFRSHEGMESGQERGDECADFRRLWKEKAFEDLNVASRNQTSLLGCLATGDFPKFSCSEPVKIVAENQPLMMNLGKDGKAAMSDGVCILTQRPYS